MIINGSIHVCMIQEMFEIHHGTKSWSLRTVGYEKCNSLDGHPNTSSTTLLRVLGAKEALLAVSLSTRTHSSTPPIERGVDVVSV